MLILRFMLLFESPSRTGLHNLIFRKHIIFLIQCIAATSLFSMCLKCPDLATE